MLVKELMSPNAEYISPDLTIQQAAEKMNSLDVGYLPVGENDKLVGSITDRDITIRAVAKGMDPSRTPVRDVMTKEIIYCFEDEPVEKAAKKMEDHQVRRLTVLNRNKRLVGICSIGDIAQRRSNRKIIPEIMESVSAHHE